MSFQERDLPIQLDGANVPLESWLIRLFKFGFLVWTSFQITIQYSIKKNTKLDSQLVDMPTRKYLNSTRIQKCLIKTLNLSSMLWQQRIKELTMTLNLSKLKTITWLQPNRIWINCIKFHLTGWLRVFLPLSWYQLSIRLNLLRNSQVFQIQPHSLRIKIIKAILKWCKKESKMKMIIKNKVTHYNEYVFLIIWTKSKK